jgi:hypothetical protein
MEIVWRATPVGLGGDAEEARSQARSVPYDLGASDGDDELAAGVAVLHLPDGLGGLAQRVGLVDDRRHLAGLDEPGEHEQVGRVLRAHDRGQPLPHEPRQHRCPQAAIESSEPPAAGLAPDDDQRPVSG